MNRLVFKIERKSIFYLCLIYTFFPPLLIERLSDRFNTFQDSLRIFFMLVLILLLIRQRNMKLSRTFLYWIVFCVYGVILTAFLNFSGMLPFLTTTAFQIISVLLLFLYIKNDNQGIEPFFNCMTSYWCILIVFNAICMLIFPNGIIYSRSGASTERANWLFGSKNNIIVPMLMAFLFVMVACQKAKGRKKIKYVVIIAIGFLELVFSGSNGVEFFGGSATGIVVLAVLIILYLIRNILVKSKLYSSLTVMAVAVIFMLISFGVIYITVNQVTILNGIFSILGKNTTITGRDSVWRMAISMITQSPLFGYGYVTVHFTDRLTGFYSYFMEWLLRYGCVGTAIIFLIFHAYNGKPKNLSKFDPSIKYVFMVGIICFMMCGIVNSIKWSYFVAFLEMYALADVDTDVGLSICDEKMDQYSAKSAIP